MSEPLGRYLARRLLSLIPVLFGQGRHLFDGLPAEQIELERTNVVAGPGGTTHLRYRVIK